MDALVLNNPWYLEPDELLQSFHLRHEALDDLVQNLQASQPEHKVLVGARGMGKTTLLYRLSIQIAREEAIRNRYRALNFPEEQWTVTSLADFYQNCITSLGHSLEREGRLADVHRLALSVQELGEKAKADALLKILLNEARSLNQTFVLLVDNADVVLGEIKGLDARKFATLLKDGHFLFVGATTNLLAPVFSKAKSPFVGIFRPVNLEKISFTEMQQMFEKLSARDDNRTIREWLSEPNLGHLKALHLLTGGNVRTILILYRVISSPRRGDIRSEVSLLLDEITPLYEPRLRYLGPQSRKLLATLAAGWPYSLRAREVADKAKVDIGTVSGQLARFITMGIVEKSPRQRRERFAFAEPLFAFWVNFRSDPEFRRNATSYVSFLGLFYSIDDEVNRVLKSNDKQIPHFRDHARVLAAAIKDWHVRRDIRVSVRDQLPEYLQDWWDESLAYSAAGFHDLAAEICREQIKRTPDDPMAHNLLGNLQGTLGDLESARAEFERAIEILPDYADAWIGFGLAWAQLGDHFKAEFAFLRAAEVGATAHDRAEGWKHLGSLFQQLNRLDEAERAFRNAVNETARDSKAWLMLGALLFKKGDDDTEMCLREAIELSPCDLYALCEFADFLYSLGRTDECVTICRRAIEANRSEVFPRALMLDIAQKMIQTTGWSEAAQIVETALSKIGSDSTTQELFFWFQRGFLATAVILGHAAACAKLLVDLDLDRAWLPLYEALMAIDDPDRLEQLAPGAREPATKMHDALVVAQKVPALAPMVLAALGPGQGASSVNQAATLGLTNVVRELMAAGQPEPFLWTQKPLSERARFLSFDDLTQEAAARVVQKLDVLKWFLQGQNWLLRRASLCFLPNCSFLAISKSDTPGQNEVFAIERSDGSVKFLNWSPDPLYDLFLEEPPDLSDSNVIVYCRFFLHFVRAQRDRMKIVEELDDIEWNGQETSEIKTEVKQHLKPFKIIERAQDHVRLRGTIVFRNALLASDIIVATNPNYRPAGDELKYSTSLGQIWFRNEELLLEQQPFALDQPRGIFG